MYRRLLQAGTGFVAGARQFSRTPAAIVAEGRQIGPGHRGAIHGPKHGGTRVLTAPDGNAVPETRAGV